MPPISRASTVLASIVLTACEPKTDAGDEVGDETTSESESETTTSETETSTSETSTSETSTSESETETETTTTSESETESETETTETGDPEPIEPILANADWFPITQVLAHRRLGDDEQLLLGGYTFPEFDEDEDLVNEAGVLAIDLDGTTRWKSIEPWPELVRMVHEFEPLADGGTWVTGGSYDEATLGDGPGWIWIGALDFAGSWSFLIDTPYGDLPRSTAVRSDGSAAILQSSMGGYGMHDFSAVGELEWSLDGWGTMDQWAQQVVAVPGGVVSGGSEGDVLDPSEQRWPWFQRISDAGEPLDEVVHLGPADAHDDVMALRYDDAALTVEVLIQRGVGRTGLLWLTLDVDDLSLLATRELGPGSPREFEIDGSGGAWVVTVHDGRWLHHFDAAGNPTWTTSIPLWRDVAFDRQGARAYGLRQELSGIDVLPL